jgi:hypothetical protein
VPRSPYSSPNPSPKSSRNFPLIDFKISGFDVDRYNLVMIAFLNLKANLKFIRITSFMEHHLASELASGFTMLYPTYEISDRT